MEVEKQRSIFLKQNKTSNNITNDKKRTIPTNKLFMGLLSYDIRYNIRILTFNQSESRINDDFLAIYAVVFNHTFHERELPQHRLLLTSMRVDVYQRLGVPSKWRRQATLKRNLPKRNKGKCMRVFVFSEITL